MKDPSVVKSGMELLLREFLRRIRISEDVALCAVGDIGRALGMNTMLIPRG